MALNLLNGGQPSHAQSSLPALPAHLQSDTHLTAHLASRYELGIWDLCGVHQTDMGTVSTFPCPLRDFHHKR